MIRFFIITLLFYGLNEIVAESTNKWEKLDKCKYLENKANDGDSFHVMCDKEYLFRLYFVDTPESEESLQDRIQDQADYFNISKEQSLELGKIASNFTKETLVDRKLTIYTRWKDAMGRSKMKRYYAIVIVNRRSLAERLVENGLARIYGANTKLPDGSGFKDYKIKLKVLEDKAKKNKVGGWKFNSE